MIEYQHPDLSTLEHIVAPNRYRIGDSVALLHLRNWIDTHYGPKQWYLARDPGIWLNILQSACTDPMVQAYEWHHASKAPESAVVFEDGRPSLWFWNDYFQRTGHRLSFDTSVSRHYRIVFAPLLEVEYAHERRMHPRFVYQVAQELGKRFPDPIILGHDMNAHDLSMLRSTGVPVLVNVPLPEAMNLIGNARCLISGDTGLSHIGGCYPHLLQIALHDRGNTEMHREREYDHMSEHRQLLQQITGSDLDCEYNSFPNKDEDLCRRILFDAGGMDGETVKQVMRTLDGWYEQIDDRVVRRGDTVL